MMQGLIFANAAASAAIVIILLLRKFFKDKVFSKVFVLLWALVIFRLLLPFEFSSGISLYAPIIEPQSEISGAEDFAFPEDTPESGYFVPAQKPDSSSESRERGETSVSPGKILFGIWLSGAVLTGGFFILKHRFFIKKVLADCVPLENVSTDFSFGKTRFLSSKTLCSPLSFGILRPTVVIPENIGEKQLPFVLLHEHTHIKNRDAALKTAAAFALSIHWFNPLVWTAVKYLDRDMERFCDERVLSSIGSEKAALYANAILDFAEKENLSPSLSFFSAASLEERVISIMKHKTKRRHLPAVFTIFTATLLIMTACGTVPAPKEKEPVSAGNLSEENSEAEKIDNALQEMMESELEKDSVVVVIDSGNVVNEIPGLAEELMGYYGDVPPNNYCTEAHSFRLIEKIEKISVSGFSFSEGSSVSVLLIPSNETKVSITYGDALRENGICVETNGSEIIISTKTPCENLEEAFDLRIYGDFGSAEIDIENLGYSVYDGFYEIKHAKPPEGGYEPGDTLTYIKVEDLELQLVSPVAEGWIASKFGSYKGHAGIDIASETGTGTEILAAADGQVVKVKRDNTGYGYHIIINHGNGIQTCYAHLSDVLVELGQEVKAGDIIASMGSTGNSTGVHLHFEIRVNGEYIDPEEFIIF